MCAGICEIIVRIRAERPKLGFRFGDRLQILYGFHFFVVPAFFFPTHMSSLFSLGALSVPSPATPSITPFAVQVWLSSVFFLTLRKKQAVRVALVQEMLPVFLTVLNILVGDGVEDK